MNYEQIKEIAEKITRGKLSITRLNPREEQGRIAGGSRNVEASIIAGRNAGSDHAESRSRRQTRKEKLTHNSQVETDLEKFAKKENIWFDFTEFEKQHEYLTSGQEARVYYSSENVLKVIDYDFGSYGISPLEFLDRIAIFNYLFPATKYELIGFTRDQAGRFRFIYQQPFIKGDPPTPAARTKYMKRVLGGNFEELTPEQYISPDYHIWDLHLKNLIQDTRGEIFVIDTLLELNTLERHLGGTREYMDFRVEESENP